MTDGNECRDSGNGSRTFIKITNKDIFDKISALETEVRNYHGCNTNEHQKFIGKFNLQYWLIGAALTMAGYSILWLWTVVTAG